MQNGDAGTSLLKIEDLFAASLQSEYTVVATLIVLDIQKREICSEAFAQPDVVPVFFSDGVAEPLMSNLVRDQANPLTSDSGLWIIEDLVLTIKNRTGVFSASAEARRFYIRQLLV